MLLVPDRPEEPLPEPLPEPLAELLAVGSEASTLTISAATAAAISAWVSLGVDIVMVGAETPEAKAAVVTDAGIAILPPTKTDPELVRVAGKVIPLAGVVL